MRSAGIERLDDPGEVRERAGQAIHLVDNDQIDLPFPMPASRSCKAGRPRFRPALSNWEIIHARRPTGGERARVSARRPAHSRIPSECRHHGRPLQACRVAGRRYRSASRPGGGPCARCEDPARSHERGIRRRRHSRRLGLEGRLRSGRGRDGAVHPALRPSHAPRGRRRTAGSAAAMLAMLETLAALEPSQTRRSEEQLALQQFSTPLPLAYAALQAAAIRPGDIVLEPSAGTGMLAVMAECALGKRTDDARSGDPLHLNEIAAVRAGLLAGLFQDAPVTRHNAEFHRRLSAGPASHCGVDEPAVFGEPRGPAHPP